MIHRLEVENFRSFNQRVLLDFTVKPEKAGRAGYVETRSGEVVSRVNMLIGPNASGKSNILKALVVLHWALVESAGQDAREVEHLFRFFGNPDLTRIAIECSDGGEELYRYEVALGPEPRFIGEKLSVRLGRRAKWKIIFDRRLDKKGEFRFPETEGDWGTIAQRPNASLVGSRLLAGIKPGIASPEWELAHKIKSFMANSFGNIAPEFEGNPDFSWQTVGKRLAQDKTLLRQAGLFMRNADIGITGLTLQKITVNNPRTGTAEILNLPSFVHSIGTKNGSRGGGGGRE
ncbi:MAG: AAA family ATPase [Opitutaceae bacterium]|jgi:energy-coupling factor transporter ATP-binding protein EcfA2|nr:AAA family ATPase [Opitutaceae bacterium]